jgi:hypothetical protein
MTKGMIAWLTTPLMVLLRQRGLLLEVCGLKPEGMMRLHMLMQMPTRCSKMVVFVRIPFRHLQRLLL